MKSPWTTDTARALNDRLWRICPTCNGKGLNPQMPSLLCPKCKGERRIPRSRM